jgi:hypothetical protein
MNWNSLIELLVQRPLTIFILLAGLFGYAYFEQSKEMNNLIGEVGGLRAESLQMAEIIILKVELASLAQANTCQALAARPYNGKGGPTDL